jgi:Putative Ig domain
MTLGLGKIGTDGTFQKGTAGTVARMQTRGRTAPPWLLCLCVLSAMFSYGCALGQGTDASTMRVTTSSLPNGAIKSGYSSGLTASGGVAPYSWKAVGGTLPPGLQISPSTGMIAGMPSTTGKYIFTVEATDSSTRAKTALRGLSITIGADALPLSISSSGLPNGELRVSYTSPVNVSGGTAPYTWSVSSGSLPAGLSLNSANGTISGTPTTSGAFPFSLSVKDSSTDPQSASQSLAITVETMVQVTTSSLPSGTAKTEYSAALGAQGGLAPYSWRVNSGSLPAGLTLSQGGAISGMPAQSGNTSFSVAVTDSSSTPQTMTQSLSVNIQTTNSAPAQTPLSVSTSGVVNGISSQSYSGSISASGGTSPYTYAVTAGSLPAGLSLNGSTGAISGSPATSGTFPFTVQVKDSSASQQTASASTSVIIVGPLQITTTTLPAMQAQSAVNATINISGGMSPFAFGLASGNLPAGLTLNSSTGQISGTPTNAGEYRFTLQVTDPPSLPQTASQTFAGNVTQANNSTPSPVQITTATLTAATQGNSYSATVAATGGTTPYNWTVASGSLPAGLSLATNGTISGTPSSSGSFPVGVTVTDSSATPETATQTYTLTVQASAPPPPPGNPANVSDTLTIYEVDGTAQAARPVTFGRVFAQGEIVQCPQPLVGGAGVSAWQADIKNRWPDGSVKFAVISLIAGLNSASSATVSFQNSATCNNTGYISTSSTPSFATFNNGNWDAQIKVSAAGSTSVTTSAKTMLAASDPGGNTYGDCKNDYWLQGPVVTAVIVQDCTAAMSADFGWSWNGSTMSAPAAGSAATASFHPMFILYFYPSINAVQAEEIIELPWNGKVQDQLADLSFSTEDSSGALHARWSRTGARVIAGVAASVSLQAPPSVSTATLTATGANFSSNDVGMPVCVMATYSSYPNCGTIQSVMNATTVVMALPTGSGWGGGSGLTAWLDLQSAASRHRKTFWSGTAPGHIRIDHNFAYLIATKALPSYDLVNAFVNPANGNYPSGKCCDFGWSGWINTDRGEIGGFSGENADYAAVLEGAPLRRQDLAYLYNMSTCGSASSACAEAWQQLTGTTALGDLSTHAGLDGSATTQYDVNGGGGEWDNFGNVPFHFRESRSAPSAGGGNGLTGTANCFYVSQFENKNATLGTTLNASAFSQCLGGGDGNVADPTGPNNATGKVISVHAHSDTATASNTFGPSAVGSALDPLAGYAVADEGQYHWLDFSYLPYLLTGSPYYVDSMYQSSAYEMMSNPNYLNSAGIFNLYNSNYIFRWYAWAMQTTGRAAFVAPDGSAEQAYFTSVVNSNLEFVEGALGVAGTTLTPSASQGGFATSGTVTNYNVNAANRWDLGRYTAIGLNCTTGGSGSCAILPSNLHQWAQGGCVSYVATPSYFNNANTSSFAQYWMYNYIGVVLGELRDMGYSQAASVDTQTMQFLEGMTLSPTGNPWLNLASYEAPLTSGNSSSCPGDTGVALPFFTRYGGSTGLFSGYSSAVGSPNNFSAAPPSGGISTGNFPCADHGYSLLARASGTYLLAYGANEADADGTYTPSAAWTWLNGNVPYFGNSPYQALSAECVTGSDLQIKWALTPRQ